MLNVKDINEYMEFQSKRRTNPLEPEYVGVDANGKKIKYGKVKGSASRRLHPITINKEPSKALHTDDILGA